MHIKGILKQYSIVILLAVTSCLFYWSFGYDLVRTDYIKLLMLYAALFFLFFKLVQLLKHNLMFLTWLAFGFRALFILAIPNLSQDFYRFIWDGRMILEGYNPYLYTPESFISKGEFTIAQAQKLYQGMGILNGSHFSNYPPLNQLCFMISALFAGKSILGSVIGMRLLIIAADFGTLYFGKRLLQKLKMPVHHIFWYLLNPFIIIELTGNLHFEGVMIFLFVWSMYLLHIGKWKWSAVVFALSVSMKLIPLILLPVFYVWFRKNKTNDDGILNQVQDNKTYQKAKGITTLITFYGIVGSIVLILFLPFYSLEFMTNFIETTGLWFSNFEFNASIFYLARTIGYAFVNFDIIGYYGNILAVALPILILGITIKRRHKTSTQDIIVTMLFVLSLYYFTATTVHPWYMATLLILAVFTRYKFVLIWSLVVMLSYVTYAQPYYTENLWIIGLEYSIVYLAFIWEVMFKKNIKV